MSDSALNEIMALKDPDQMFDLIVMMAYMRGNLNGMVPVDESRQVFEKIKKLLTPTNPKE